MRREALGTRKGRCLASLLAQRANTEQTILSNIKILLEHRDGTSSSVGRTPDCQAPTYSSFESYSLRQLHLTKHSLPARQRAKNFNKHRY